MCFNFNTPNNEKINNFNMIISPNNSNSRARGDGNYNDEGEGLIRRLGYMDNINELFFEMENEQTTSNRPNRMRIYR